MKNGCLFFAKSRIARIITRVVAALLLVAMLSGLYHSPVRAADDVTGETAGIADTKTGTPVSNAYILDVVTGLNPGDWIGFFLIKYISGGQEYREYIFPQEDSEAQGRKIVVGIGTDNDTTLLKEINDEIGYSTQNDWNARGQSLGRYKQSQFYFTPHRKIDKVLSIDAYGNLKPGEAKEWTCQGLRLFEVSELYGLKMAGTWSNNWYIDFKGQLIAEVVTTKYNWQATNPGMLRIDRAANGSTLRTDFKGIDYATHLTQDARTYGFRVDFADYYGAGFESLAAEYEDGPLSVMKMRLSENLSMNVTYTDVYGQTRFAHLPATTSTAAWLGQRGLNAAIYGLAQQGSTIGFTGELPDCKNITGISLTVGNEMAAKDAEIKSVKTFARRTKREEASATDGIRITNVAVYDMATAGFQPYMDEAMLKYGFSGKPILYHLSGTARGDEYPLKNATGVSLAAYDDKTMEFSKKMDGYLVEIDTDNMAAAATTSDLFIKFKYRTLAGIPKETDDLSLKDLLNEYYGYWPGNVDYFPYRYGTTQGGTLRFFLSEASVDYFTGAVISMGENGDDYQFSNLKIFSITSSGERRVTWNEVGRGNVKSHLEVYREVDGVSIEQSDVAIKITPDLSGPVLIQPGNRQPIDFISNTVEELEDNKFDIDEYTISYAKAMENFGFAKARKDYEVTVKVFDDVANSSDGVIRSNEDLDSGSNNKFFFQLVFANGTSGFVQANQQLDSDRFQSGREHTFHITTNQDYGEIQGIRIIPDDKSIDEDAEPYDKINIEKISILDGDTEGTHRCWECNDIGWIGIDYVDAGQMTGIVAKSGRSLSELTKTYPIDHVSNVIDLEFSLQTALGDKSTGINPATGVNERIYADQLVGKLFGKLYYTDTNGKAQTKTYDLVYEMYRYLNRKVTASDGGVKSDSSIMLRENHTDRFILSIPDLKSVKALEIEIRDPDYHPYRWNIAGVSGRMVEERGRLRINANDEYEYEIINSQIEEGANEPFTQVSGSNPAHSVEITGTNQTVYIAFNDNEFKVDTERGIATSVYSRTPLSKDDKLNIYAFPVQGNRNNGIDEYDLSCTVFYAHPAGLYRAGTDKMKKFYGTENSRPMFYETGLSASAMTDINRVMFSANSSGANMAEMDYAIIQQVRQDTVIATYFVDLDSQNALLTEIEKFPTKNTAIVGYSEYQTVALQLGDATDSIGLYTDRVDVGVSIDYRTAFDADGVVYHSPIIYLTDQKINAIKAGKVVELNFEQYFVGEVVSVNVLCLGKINVSVDSAYVATYHRDTAGNDTRQGWYSFASGIVAAQDPVKMTQTARLFDDENSVKPLTFTFTTSGPSANYESGSKDPVRATIYTTDINGNAATPLGTIPDLRKYLVDNQGNFITGTTQKVKLLIAGAVNIRRIRIEPYRGDGTAGWSIESASAQLGDDISATRAVEARFYENDPKDITFANITLTADVFNFNPNRNAYDQSHVTNDTMNIITVSGQPVYISPIANGSELGVEVKVVEVSGESVSGNLSSFLTYEGGRYKFSTPRNQSGKTRYYRISAWSTENPGAKVEVNITVDNEETSEKTSEETSDDSKGEDTSTETTTYTITKDTESGEFEVSPGIEGLKEGDTVTLTAAPKSNQEFVEWVVIKTGGTAIATTKTGDLTATFTMPDENVSIRPVYKEIESTDNGTDTTP